MWFGTRIGKPEGNAQLGSFGVKLSSGGAHISRTMMLTDVSRLLGVVGPEGTLAEYRRAVTEENVLGKATETTRRKTFRHLRELYGLSEAVPLFRVFRDLMGFDPSSAPLLSLLVAWSRDPLLRATTPAVLGAAGGEVVGQAAVQAAFMGTYPHQYSQSSVATVTRNAASSWTQAGHLQGRVRKVRCKVQPRPAALALALLLGHVGGFRGERIFASPWCRLLDLSGAQARSMAVQAHREELVTMRAIGSVVEVSFPRFDGFLGGLP